jgi:hypothetical protein
MLTDFIQLGDPVEHRGVVVAPLFPRRTPVAAYLTLDEATGSGFRVTEVDAAGLVPELAVVNPLAEHVLLYDGEELVGAKQNRILNVTVLVEAQSKLRIPVTCVEQGRWASRSAAFRPAAHVTDPELRRRKNVRIAGAPLARGEAQHEVWNAVNEKALRLGAYSPTAAHADTFKRHERSLDEIVAAFPLVPGQTGALLALGAETLCLDYVSRPDAFARLYPKLLAGYALDALERLDRPAPPAGTLEGLLASADATVARRQPSEGLGDDLRLDGRGLVGSGLELDGELIQLSVFTHGHAFERPGRIARPSTRR